MRAIIPDQFAREGEEITKGVKQKRGMRRRMRRKRRKRKKKNR